MNVLKYSLSFLGLVSVVVSSADTVDIDRFYFSSAKAVPFVALGDTVGIKPSIDPMDYTPSIPLSEQKIVKSGDIAKLVGKSPAYITLTSKFENKSFIHASIKIEGLKDYKVLLDGKDFSADKVALKPGTHTLSLSFLSDKNNGLLPSVKIETENGGAINPVFDGKRMMSLGDLIYGERIVSTEISPSGNYIIATYSDTNEDGTSNYSRKLFDAGTGKFKMSLNENLHWMPKSEEMWTIRNDFHKGRHIVKIDPATMEESLLVADIPDGNFEISPTEDFLIYRMVRKGPKEDEQVYRIIEPEDRQPRWRNRSYPAIYRLSEKRLMPLAHSKENLDMLDISDDGKKLLLMSSTRRITERPTTLFSLIQLDITNMKADTLVYNDGFINGAYFSPDAKSIVVTGSPEAFDRVGCTLPQNVIPSTYDIQLYLLNIADKSVKPLTRNLNPSVIDSRWSRYDDKLYVTTNDKDKRTLYRIDPKTADFELIELPENAIGGISTPETSAILSWWGQSENKPDGLYTLDTRTNKSALLDRPAQDRLSDIKIPISKEWNFTTSRGDTVCGTYYLPDNFDPTKKYPLIVYYYGGCSPSTRLFVSRYPMNLYASHGYVALMLEPSGAAGFGQEWSSRHVSTAGKGVAEDIIEATKQFCSEMPYVNAEKIGCLGASYGGFMTQYLQTQTDLFSAAVSHAGISDHTSYWGEGYWGYSYSEVAMAESYPWNQTDLFVKQSPLYNADKINTPILFLHGDADMNVPLGESIQMFTALKLLGKDTAFVAVADQEHHILDYHKRLKWQDTIFAWFAKYLKDDPTWWNHLYPEKNL